MKFSFLLSNFRDFPKIADLAFFLDEKWPPTRAREQPNFSP